MKTLLLTVPLFLLLTSSTATAQTIQNAPKCEKVQALLNLLSEIRGEQIKGNSYQCKDHFIIEDFQSCTIHVVQGEKRTNWKVAQQSIEMSREIADSVYLKLAHELVKCVYLNSWKVNQETSENAYHFKINQTISSDNRLKNITLSLLRVGKSEKWKLELALVN